MGTWFAKESLRCTKPYISHKIYRCVKFCQCPFLLNKINAIRNKSEILTTWQNVRIVFKQIIAYHTIRDWNALPDPLISSAEGAEDGVAKFNSLARAGD